MNYSRHNRRGMTLIEIMVAMTMTLIVLGAMMAAFQYASTEMARGRAVIELSSQLRVADSILRRDLEGLTVEVRPFTQTTTPPGYFELVEGPRRDATDLVTGGALADQALVVSYGYLGDVDDILAMTVRNQNRNYRGRLKDLDFDGDGMVAPPGDDTNGDGLVDDADDGATTSINSEVAEVVWWTTFGDRDGDATIDFDESVVLYRRALVLADITDVAIFPDGPTLRTGYNLAQVNDFFRYNDVSARIVSGAGGTFDIVANTLEDLSNRANRFCHRPETSVAPATNFPFTLNRGTPGTSTLDDDGLLERRMYGPDGLPSGDDIILADIAAFDLKVYSPDALVNVGGGTVVEPGDPGYVTGGVPMGAFADLDHNGGTSWFFQDLATISMPDGGTSSDPTHPMRYYFLNDPANGFDVVYDTWTPFYESNGRDEDGDGVIDQAMDGIDSDSLNGVDDPGEREALPLFGTPVRGIKATVRVVEKQSKQVRQASVITSFVPE